MNEIYSDFFIKGKVDKEDNSLKNFINYIFGYEETIEFENILNTQFFTSDYNGSGLDKLFPLSSMPKNGNCYKNTFFNSKNGEMQIHITLEEDQEQFMYLMNTISELIFSSEEFIAYYRNEKMVVPKLYRINNYSIEEIDFNNSNEYKNVWNKHFKNLNIKY